MPSKKKLIIYFAAALFNGPDKQFNIRLATELERKGYNVFLPQRDGYEFASLDSALSEVLLQEEVAGARQTIIRLLDLGIFVPRSNIVLVRLDEPLDPGADVETVRSRLMGKAVVGFRTDVRSPYGLLSEPLGGMHFFLAAECFAFVSYHMFCRSVAEAEREFKILVNKILVAIETALEKARVDRGHFSVRNENNQLMKQAELLFEGIFPNIHSPKALAEIACRYKKHREGFRTLFPVVI